MKMEKLIVRWWFGDNLLESHTFVRLFVVWIWLRVLGGQQWIYELCWLKPWCRSVFKCSDLFLWKVAVNFYRRFPLWLFFSRLHLKPWNKFLCLLHISLPMEVCFSDLIASMQCLPLRPVKLLKILVSLRTICSNYDIKFWTKAWVANVAQGILLAN